MTDPPITLWWLMFATTSAATIFYAAVVGGLFKNSLMEQFRKYGPEQRVYPVCRLLIIAGLNMILFGLLLPIIAGPFTYFQSLFPCSLFLLLALALWGASVVIYQRPALRESLPRWYFELLRTTTRQERRRIGYAWMRIPFQMRLRLNGDQKAFRVWAELVRLTVIYGAYDPDSPWDVWT